MEVIRRNDDFTRDYYKKRDENIVKEYNEGKLTVKQISAKYGFATSRQVYRIVRREELNSVENL